MLRLSEVLELHRRHSGVNSFADNLGDGYLYSYNPVYRVVRDRAVELGAVFSSKDSDFWRQYQVAPFFCLQSIFERSIVPYFDNARALELVLHRNPEFTLPAHLFIDNFKRNYLLHETAHYVAFRRASQSKEIACTNGFSGNHWLILQTFLSEAFANAVERTALSYAVEAPHLLFFVLNSYVRSDAAEKEAVRKASATFGVEAIFRLALLHYFHSNTSPDPVPAGLAERFVRWAAAKQEITAAESEFLHDLAESSFNLNPSFREETTLAYFRFLECEQELSGFAGRVENWFENKWLLDIFDEFASMVADGIDASGLGKTLYVDGEVEAAAAVS